MQQSVERQNTLSKIRRQKVGVFGEKTVTLHFGSEVGFDIDLQNSDNQPEDKPSAHIILE